MSMDQWTWRTALAQATQRLADRGLVRLNRPVHEYKDLGELEDIEKVTDLALANMLFRYQAWYSYASVELSYAEVELASFDEVFEVKVAAKMHIVAKTQEGRVLKDVLRSLAINSDEELKGGLRSKIEYEQSVGLLRGLVRGLDIRCRALEQESIRRASARKVEVSR